MRKKKQVTQLYRSVLLKFNQSSKVKLIRFQCMHACMHVVLTIPEFWILNLNAVCVCVRVIDKQI